MQTIQHAILRSVHCRRTLVFRARLRECTVCTWVDGTTVVSHERDVIDAAIEHGAHITAEETACCRFKWCERHAHWRAAVCHSIGQASAGDRATDLRFEEQAIPFVDRERETAFRRTGQDGPPMLIKECDVLATLNSIEGSTPRGRIKPFSHLPSFTRRRDRPGDVRSHYATKNVDGR